MKQKQDPSIEQGLALRCPNFAQMLDGPLAGGFGCMVGTKQDLARNQVGALVRCKPYRTPFESCDVVRQLFPGESRET